MPSLEMPERRPSRKLSGIGALQSRKLSSIGLLPQMSHRGTSDIGAGGAMPHSRRVSLDTEPNPDFADAGAHSTHRRLGLGGGAMLRAKATKAIQALRLMDVSQWVLSRL